jgi:hypothetical protein
MSVVRSLRAIFASMMICVSATSVRAEPFRVGSLLCASSPRVGRILGSTQHLRCVFHRRGSSKQYVYEGRVRRVGLDIGVTRVGTLSWVVFSRSSRRIGPGRLTGSYVGASASIALGPGFGANALIGGSRRSIVLQPLSVERAIGVNLAAGLTNLTLSARGTR